MAARRSSSESTSDLYIRLGLSLDELESGFVNAQRTVRDNMTRLQRENTIIDLQMQVDLTGLDSIEDAERILEVRTQALNRQLENQRDRVRLATAELRNMTDRTGANSDQTQRATLALERERLALAQLEDQLRSLRDEQDATNDSSNSWLDSIQEFIETRAPAVAAILAIAASFEQVTSAIQDMVEEFHELQKQSYELNLDIGDAEEFLRHMELAGGDIGDFEGYIRGITDAFVKGEIDDPEFVALSRYGAELTDASGRLKNFQELTEEVYQAWKKAAAEGNEIEFLQLTGGEAGVRDAIQYFRRYEEAKEDAEKVFDAGLKFEELHELDRELKLLTEQTSEFGEALLNLSIPAVRFGIETLFEIIKAGTEIVVDSTEKIQLWGFRIAEATKRVIEPIRNFEFEGLDLGTDKANKELADFEQKYEELINTSPWQQALDKFYHAKRTEEHDFVEQFFIDLDRAAKNRQAEYNFQLGATVHFDPDATPEVTIDEFLRDLEEEVRLQEEIGETAKKTGDILSQYASKRITQYQEDLEDLRIELDNGGNDYLREIAEAEKWFERETKKKLYLSSEERLAIEELYSAKLEQIEQERADKLEEIRESVASEERTAFENKLVTLEKEKDAWLAAGMEEEEAAELHQRRLTQLEQERTDKLAEIRESVAAADRSALENKIAAIEKEKKAWREAGMDEAEIVKLSQQRINQVREEALKKARDLIKETADLGYALTHDAFEKQLYDIERWKQAQMEKAETAEEVAATIANAAMREADAFEREIDRMQGRIESGQDQLARLTLSQYDNDIRNAYKQFQKNIEDQMPPDLAQAIFDAQMRQIKRRARDDTTGKYRESPDKPDDGPVLIDFKRRVKDQNQMLLDMDSRQWAMQETMARAAEISSDTVNQAMAKVKEIEAQRERPSEPAKKKSKVIYGDDYDDTSYNKHGGGVILNFEKLSQTTDKATSVLDGATANVESVFESLKTSTANADGALSALSTTTTEVNQSISELTIDAALKNISDAFTQTAEILADINGQLSQLDFKIPERVQQTAESSGNFDVYKRALEGTSLAGEIQSVIGLFRGDPRIAVLGALLQLGSNAALYVDNLSDDLTAARDDAKGVGGTDLNAAMEPLTQELRTLTQDVSSRLTEITQMAGEIAANTKQAPQQNITVSPSINIDLGGAYVFDDAMKQQLTDDITRDVANAVTDAVKKATDKTDYSYGR